MKPLNLRDPLYWLVIIAFGFFTLWQCESGKRKELERAEDGRLHREQVATKEAEIRTLGVALATERQARQKDSVRISKRLTGLKTASTTIAHKTATKRQEIQPYLDSLEVVREFVALQDEALAIKDTTIEILEGQIDTLRRSYNRERRLLETQSLKTNELVALWQGQANNYESLFRKADRKASRKFTVGPYFGYGVSANGLSPSVGLSVQYRILRF